MTTIFEKAYDYSIFFEASGSWTAPDQCVEALIIGSGGGGGGGFGGSSHPPSHPPGGDGGDTTFVGTGVSLNFPGGAGGSGGSSNPSIGGNPGGGGRPFGRRGSFNNQGISSVAGTFLYSENSFRSEVSFDIFFRGGAGAPGGTFFGGPSPAPYSTRTALPGALLNGGSGTTGVYNATAASAFWAGGGEGGYAVGIRRKTAIVPGGVYTITIGAGGNGGTRNPAAPSAVHGGGGGGAGGFIYILWNE
jgi:hypothetical protein